MYNMKVTTADVITVILTTAMSAGGFYLLGFLLGFLIVTPLQGILAYLLLNVLNIWYHFSKYYKRVFSWVNVRAQKAINYLNEQPWFWTVEAYTIRAKNFIVDSKVASYIKIAFYWSSIKVMKGISAVKNLFKKSEPQAKFVSPAVNATVVS